MKQAKPKTAIALKYEQNGTPRVTAKGEGEMAERILSLAREHNIEIEENPLLAEALSQIELNEDIPPELYVAIAQIIRFILNCRADPANTTKH